MRLIYKEARPYGAPLLILRGGATKDQDVKARLRENGFRWDGHLFAWTTYTYDTEATLARVVGDREDIEIEEKV